MNISEKQLSDKFKSERYDCEAYKKDYNVLDIWNTYGTGRDLYRRGQDYRGDCIWCGKKLSMAVSIRTEKLIDKVFGSGIVKCFDCGESTDTVGLAVKLTGMTVSDILKEGKRGGVIKYMP